MQIDAISFNDISIFHPEEEFSIFHKLNFTRTTGGKEWLRFYFTQPLDDLSRIRGTQDLIRALIGHLDHWPEDISNGTVLVIDKFLDYALDSISSNLNSVNSIAYKLLHSEDYSMSKYSITHFADFFRGLRRIVALLEPAALPANTRIYIDRIAGIISEPSLRALSETKAGHRFTIRENLYYAKLVRVTNRTRILELIDIYSRIDAWYSMAMAVRNYNLVFPEFIDSATPLVDARGLYHLLLPKPVPYDLQMDPAQNFLFLTGANMAGKSTLIKSVGTAVFLAHLGMGVPAAYMRLTLFDGLLSNINVTDNIAKGESFFFNEVQRIRNTIEKINNGKKWLVLIDELFKGTNVEDAMKCSLAVIRGFVKIRNSLFILSTHLYEIGKELNSTPNIAFKYFETNVENDQLSFSYQLKDGVSNDRIGYVILKREKVVEMLDNL
ncbi:MAG: DNA mismatch repair protein MutS [Chitinophagaceae bacterium]|nr:MAG: DNA mismatch repair protein MutS [Chitinophagaceae bacterium]